LLDTEGIAPSALTPDLAVELGRRLPTTPKSLIKVPNLARLFVAHLIEIGVVARPPLTPAQAERAELLSNFETHLLRQRGLSPLYHVLRFADRFLDHRFGDHMLVPQEVRSQAAGLVFQRMAACDVSDPMLPSGGDGCGVASAGAITTAGRG